LADEALGSARQSGAHPEPVLVSADLSDDRRPGRSSSADTRHGEAPGRRRRSRPDLGDSGPESLLRVHPPQTARRRSRAVPHVRLAAQRDGSEQRKGDCAMKIGLVQDGALTTGVSPEQRMDELVEEAVFADEMGFDFYGLAEVHFSEVLTMSAPEV